MSVAKQLFFSARLNEWIELPVSAALTGGLGVTAHLSKQVKVAGKNYRVFYSAAEYHAMSEEQRKAILIPSGPISLANRRADSVASATQAIASVDSEQDLIRLEAEIKAKRAALAPVPAKAEAATFDAPTANASKKPAR